MISALSKKWFHGKIRQTEPRTYILIGLAMNRIDFTQKLKNGKYSWILLRNGLTEKFVKLNKEKQFLLVVFLWNDFTEKLKMIMLMAQNGQCSFVLC